MKEIKIYLKQTSIYCDDLEKTINRDGCYDAKGSTICKACSVKPAPKKVHGVNKVINFMKLTINIITI